MKRYLAPCALLAALAGCAGGSSTGTTTVLPAPPPAPVAPTPNPLTVSPGTLTFTAGGYQLPFASGETAYTGAFSATSTDCAGIASFTPGTASGPSGAFAVTSVAAGQCHVSIADTNGQHAILTIVVTTLTGNIQ